MTEIRTKNPFRIIGLISTAIFILCLVFGIPLYVRMGLSAIGFVFLLIAKKKTGTQTKLAKIAKIIMLVALIYYGVALVMTGVIALKL